MCIRDRSWPSPFGDGNGQKQRKDALLAWKPLVKPMYEAREEKRVFREIIERMGHNPDDAYPKSNYDQWLGYFLGMRVLNEDATKWEPVITWTEACLLYTSRAHCTPRGDPSKCPPCRGG